MCICWVSKWKTYAVLVHLKGSASCPQSLILEDHVGILITQVCVVLRKHWLSAACVLTVKHREFLLVPYCPDYPDTPWSSLSPHVCLSWKYWLEASCSLLLILGPEISCCFFSVLVQRNNFLIMCAPLKNIVKYCNHLKLYQVKLCYMHHPAEDIQTL